MISKRELIAIDSRFADWVDDDDFGFAKIQDAKYVLVYTTQDEEVCTHAGDTLKDIAQQICQTAQEGSNWEPACVVNLVHQKKIPFEVITTVKWLED